MVKLAQAKACRKIESQISEWDKRPNLRTGVRQYSTTLSKLGISFPLQWAMQCAFHIIEMQPLEHSGRCTNLHGAMARG